MHTGHLSSINSDPTSFFLPTNVRSNKNESVHIDFIVRFLMAAVATARAREMDWG
jgi:hypothetical protein